MKAHSGGLGNFLNKVTQKSEKLEGIAQIIYIDIDEIESNPENFYGLRNIEELAGLIAVSHLIEPLTVSEKADGKYKLISGHRRRAAVQKLLEEGNYTERKLPCIVKTREKLEIEQENGETIEFDEDAVEMLNLIASNRGQREERTVEEKLQEVKYLERFARAIYNQKNSRRRGRFVNFFAEEILNISKSQLLRINALGKLTENVRQAVDTNKISESAAIEMSSMPEELQKECLEKIVSGELKGTIEGIQSFKTPPKIDVEEETPLNPADEVKISVEEKATSDIELESDTFNIENVAGKENKEETEEINKTSSNVLQKPEKSTVLKIEDVPEEFEDPQKEAEEWIYQASLSFYEKMCAEAKRLSEEETDKLKASQWGIRASVARYKIEEMKLEHKKNK